MLVGSGAERRCWWARARRHLSLLVSLGHVDKRLLAEVHPVVQRRHHILRQRDRVRGRCPEGLSDGPGGVGRRDAHDQLRRDIFRGGDVSLCAREDGVALPVARPFVAGRARVRIQETRLRRQCRTHHGVAGN